MALDLDGVAAIADRLWDDTLPLLHDYIAIPALSPAFDAGWEASGHLDRAVDLIADWCRRRPLAGMTVEVQRLPGRTPVILCDIPPTPGAEHAGPVLLYGHLDKQPEMTGWRDGLGPWTPVLEGDRLYGRGGADDGYSVIAALGAVEAVEANGGRHGRCFVLIEASEESGSPDLPAHIEALADRLGPVSLVVCLDSGCADYDRLWFTTSLRGLVDGTLTVRVVDYGLHSGGYGGIAPDSFRLVRALLSRLEDEGTGELRLSELHATIPEDRRRQAAATAAELGEGAFMAVPLAGGTRPLVSDPTEVLLNTWWRPCLTITGADGLPPTDRAGNVLRPSTSVKVSIRIPPTCDAAAAMAAVSTTLTTDPPHGAEVSFTGAEFGTGWNAPTFAPWLETSLDRASQRIFGAPARGMGEGGSIPFMAMLGERFPQAQFVITGVLGPDANAHGPNEYLHLPTARRVTACVAAVLDDHVGSV